MSSYQNVTSFNGTARDLASTIADEVDAIRLGLEEAESELQRILDNAESEGRSNLTGIEDSRAEFLYKDIRTQKAAVRRAESRLARAQQVADEETRSESRLNGFTATPAASQNRSDRRTATTHVTRNERTYTKESDPNGRQFLQDVANNFLYQSPASAERLQRHVAEERVERPHAAQERALGDTNTGNWGGLVVPAYLTELVTPQISNLRPFADACCVKHPLPPTGMSINISQVTTGTTVSLQAAQLTSPTATSIDDTLLTLSVQTAAGWQNVSRQAIERGVGIENTTFLDLSRKYAVAIDSTLITQSVTGLDALAQTVTYTDASPTPALMWPFLMQATSKVEQALVGVAYPTHVVMHSRRWNWLTSYVSSSYPFVGNQAVPPNSGAVMLTTEYGNSVRAILSNGLKVVVDNNVPTNLGVGTNQDVLYVVSADETMHLFEDPNAPVYIRAEQPNAASLGVLLVLYGYFAYGIRYNGGAAGAGAAKVFGTGTVAPTGF